MFKAIKKRRFQKIANALFPFNFHTPINHYKRVRIGYFPPNAVSRSRVSIITKAPCRCIVFEIFILSGRFPFEIVPPLRGFVTFLYRSGNFFGKSHGHRHQATPWPSRGFAIKRGLNQLSFQAGVV